MSKLTFFGGVAEIGGTKILLETESERVFLDFGKNYSQENKFFDAPYLQPREEKHLLSLGILPQIPGLYKKDVAEPDIDAILVTHPHTDHMDYVRFAKDSVPIYLGDSTKKIILARDLSGQPPAIEYALAKYEEEQQAVLKSFRSFQSGQHFQVNSLDVEPVHVDHSVPGAYGYIVHTRDGTLVYTGDFRRHGAYPEMTRDFVERAKAAQPHILIIEGTNIASGRVSTETEVLEKSLKVIKEASGLVMVSFSPVDLDRLVTFYQAAKESGRKLAISTKQAFLLESLGNEVRFNPLSANQGDVLVFVRQKQCFRTWEKLVLSKNKDVIEADEISRLQDQLVLVYSFYDMNEMGDIAPQPGSVFILSQSEPFTEEMEIDHSRLLNWLDFYGVPLYNIHASGHATPHELKEVIAEIASEKVFLVHTERPVLFAHFLADLPVEAITPQLGETYQFG